jgi:AcrR family transcriptional regulator
MAAPIDTLPERLEDFIDRIPPELRDPDAASPRGRIIAAARQLFADHGLDGTSIRAIAEKADVNLAMIHYYYGNKDQLYEHVLATQFFCLLQAMSALFEKSLSDAEMILAVPQQIIKILRANPIWVALMRREVAGGGQHLHAALKTFPLMGPPLLAKFFDQTYQKAADSGALRPLPAVSVRECLIAVAWGTMFMQPFFKVFFNRDIYDDSTWQEWSRTMDSLLRHGLLMENAS